jgi:pimeloyl-ACP methyl ester carboxylesterase
MLYVLFFQIPWLPERVLAANDYRVIEEVFRGKVSARPERFTDDIIQVYKHAAAAPGALTAMLNYYRALVRGGGLTRLTAQGFSVIETPTLLIWGVEDPILPPDILADANDWVTDLSIELVPDAGHWVQQEAPETVNSILRGWLQR